MINLMCTARLTAGFLTCFGSQVEGKCLRLAAALGLAAIACGGWWSAVAQTKTATSTTLAVTSGTTAVTTATSGSVITLTATVTAGSTPLTVGQVNFCDALAKACADIHLLGLAQLTSAGTAVMKFRPGPGSHQYKAVYAGTTKYASSSSAIGALNVTGPTPTVTVLASTGNPGNYSLTATVYGTGSTAPAGEVSFLNTNDANAVLGSATLANATAGSDLVGVESQTVNIFTFFPVSMVAGDFNGDGIPDIAAAQDAGPVVIALGNGDGTFTLQNTDFQTGPGLICMAVGDFNGDGKLDLVLANGSTGTATILLGNGDGTFTASSSSPATGAYPVSIAVADFNGDGVPDLAVANNQSNSLTILLGNGDGAFTSTATGAQTGSAPFFVTSADFNGDGVPDLAVLNNNNQQNTLSVYLGKGDGTFTQVTTGAGNGAEADGVAVADFNGDGIADLAIMATTTYNDGMYGTLKLSVLTGKGDGTFILGSQTTIQLGYHQIGFGGGATLEEGDFNGDGKADLALSVPNAAEPWAELLLGDGTGSFPTTLTLPFNIIGEYGPTAVVPGLGADYFAYAPGGSYSNSLVVQELESQTATATANGIALPPATGTEQVVASYVGDSNFEPSTSAAVWLSAVQGTPKATVTPSQNPVAYGTSETLTATVTGSGLTPTGFVTFYDGAGQLGTQSLTNGAASLTTAAFAVGSHSITVSYGGDGDYTARTSAALSLVVKKGPPTIGITLSSTSIVTTQVLQVGITVSGAAGNPTPQGSVAIRGEGYASTLTSLSSAGTATIAIPAGSLSVGSDTLTVTYTPSTASGGSYTSTTQSAAVTVVLIGTGGATVTVAPSPSAITDQQTDNVSVTVAGTKGAATPTGSIVLASGGYSAQMTLSSGASTFAIPAGTLSAGTDTLTATYSGDGTYAAANATAAVTVSPVVMSSTAPSPIAAGTSATATITLTAGSSYSGTLNLTCALTKSPANVQSQPICALNPSTDTIAAGGNATTTMTVNTTAGTSATLIPSKDRFWRSGAESITFAALFLMGLRVRRRRWLSILALLVIAICVVSGGCGGGSSHSTPQSTPATTAGTYVFTVKAADSKNASIATSASVSVTVQ
jgi:hypothetical protein